MKGHNKLPKCIRPLTTTVWDMVLVLKTLTFNCNTAPQLNQSVALHKYVAHVWGFIPSYPCSSADIMPPPPPLFFPRINMFFIFISVIEGSSRGTATQNRASWGGTRAPEADFFFCPWRNFSRPWNCIVWDGRKAFTGLNVLMYLLYVSWFSQSYLFIYLYFIYFSVQS